jgi:hypothetical protein
MGYSEASVYEEESQWDHACMFEWRVKIEGNILAVAEYYKATCRHVSCYEVQPYLNMNATLLQTEASTSARAKLGDFIPGGQGCDSTLCSPIGWTASEHEYLRRSLTR